MIPSNEKKPLCHQCLGASRSLMLRGRKTAAGAVELGNDNEAQPK